MKTYEEMAKSALNRIADEKKARKRQQRIITELGVWIMSIAVFIIGISYISNSLMVRDGNNNSKPDLMQQEVHNGEFTIEEYLSQEMQKSGDDKIHHIRVKIFQNGKLITDISVYNAEARRLANIGYSCNISGDTFYISATNIQIENFVVNDKLGYVLCCCDKE